MRLPLRSLIAEMPRRSPELGSWNLADASSVTTYSEVSDEYVWPDVILDEDSGLLPSPIVLVTAPGAMGKSAAAMAIAATTEMPYIDLAHVRVGSGSVTGELAKALGFKAMGEFVDDLKAGRTALVLDSLDEAQLGVGRENYLAFLSDLAWLLADAVPANQVVMLGRRDATETTLLSLMDIGLTPPLYQVAPLTHTQAAELIDRTLDRKLTASGPYTIHRRHPIPFAELRDTVFRDLACALNPSVVGEDDFWSPVGSFLGYPPVVTALSERLAVDNPGSAVAQITLREAAAQPALRGAVLRDIVEQILDRESGKVRDRIGDSLAMREASAERAPLYGRDEQVARLLHFTGTADISVDQPASLADHERAIYEELVASFVPDHPFLSGAEFSNVVFSDYVRAWAASSPIGDIYARKTPEFFATLPTVGPFFTYFLHALTTGADRVGSLHEDLVNDAIRSYTQGLDQAQAVYVHRRQQAVLVLNETHEFGDDDQALAFQVPAAAGVLLLESPVSRLLCITDYAVVIRGHEGHIDIGPEVSLVAETLELIGTTLAAYSDLRADRLVNFLSAQEVEHAADLKVAAAPDNALLISWPNPWHQWKPFAAEIVSSDRRISHTLSSQVLMCIRRVLVSFRRSVKEDPSISAEKMDRVIIGPNPVFQATFAALEGLGVVSRAGNIVRLHLDQLAPYGLSWSTMKGDDPTRRLQKIYAAVLGRPEMRSAIEGED